MTDKNKIPLIQIDDLIREMTTDEMANYEELCSHAIFIRELENETPSPS